MEMHHGSHNGQANLHIGLCLTDEEYIAEQYGDVFSADFDLDGLNVVEVEAYDHDEDYAVGDYEADIARLQAQGVDVITYDDETLNGDSHTTYRIISDAALSRIVIA